jgi:hypothetical protein
LKKKIVGALFEKMSHSDKFLWLSPWRFLTKSLGIVTENALKNYFGQILFASMGKSIFDQKFVCLKIQKCWLSVHLDTMQTSSSKGLIDLCSKPLGEVPY